MTGSVAFALVLVLATPALAQQVVRPSGPRVAASTGPRLGWHAPQSCPSADDLRARIEQRLERSLDEVAVGVDIDVTMAAGRYLARIDLAAVTVANDVRTLTSKRCSELTDAVAVIVARVASEQIARRRVALRDEDEPILVDTYEASRPVPRPPRKWTLGARVSGVSGIGVLPKVGLGGELAVTLRADHHLAELAATKWFHSAAQFHNGAPAEIDVELEVAAVRYGWRPYEMPLRAWLGVEVGNMRGSSAPLPVEQIEASRWLAAGAGFGIAWQMTGWARLFGGTEVMLAIERARFSIGDGIVVYAPSPMSFRTTCGLEVGWQ